MTESEREALRAELTEAISDFSEDCRAASWSEAAVHEAWDAMDGAAGDRYGMHVPFEWQPPLFRRLRDALGEWPDGDPDEGARWVTLAEFAALHAERASAIEAERSRRIDELRAEDLTEDDLRVLDAVRETTDAGRTSLFGSGREIGIPGISSLARLAAHGLVESTGWTVFDRRITDAGREALDGRAAPRP